MLERVKMKADHPLHFVSWSVIHNIAECTGVKVDSRLVELAGGRWLAGRKIEGPVRFCMFLRVCCMAIKYLFNLIFYKHLLLFIAATAIPT